MSLRPFYITRTVTKDDMSILWLVVGETEAGVAAGVDALRKRADGGHFEACPVMPRLNGGFASSGVAIVPGHGAEPWMVETTPFFSSDAAASGRQNSRQEPAK